MLVFAEPSDQIRSDQISRSVVSDSWAIRKAQLWWISAPSTVVSTHPKSRQLCHCSCSTLHRAYGVRVGRKHSVPQILRTGHLGLLLLITEVQAKQQTAIAVASHPPTPPLPSTLPHCYKALLLQLKWLPGNFKEPAPSFPLLHFWFFLLLGARHSRLGNFLNCIYRKK